MQNKYPKIKYLPWSHGVSKGDKIANNVDFLLGEPIVIQEKVDGSNCSIQADNCYASTHSHTPTHSSFDWVKGLHALIRHKIPPNVQLFGENLFAQKAIAYNNLPDRKSTRLNSSHQIISYAVFCLKKKNG